MKIYNTLTRKKEEFKSIYPNKVKMYVCGPTVYNFIHIGNARPLVFYDTVRRYFEYLGYEVDFVMNLTDIDDKIIDKAVEEEVDFRQLTKYYIDAFLENAESLNVDVSKIIKPKATNYIDEMISFIERLEEKGAAYDTFDTVYFNTKSAKDYGKLSKKNIEDLNMGSRVDVSDSKKSPMDFALWKKQKSENEPAWDSPWGKGRPGWHLECSTMCKEILGETIDIHGGGEDLQFPHHENEIAQSETLHEKTMANYWMHNSMVTLNKDKMSKSTGNFFTLVDIQKEIDLSVVRMWILSGHYRSQIDFSKENLEATKKGFDRLENTSNELDRFIENALDSETKYSEALESFMNVFNKEMQDDFNTANALTQMFELSKFINVNLSENSSKQDLLKARKIFDDMLSILGIKFEEKNIDQEVEDLIEQRNQARKQKDFKKADEIRDKLKDMGIELKDTSTGVTWRKIN